MKKRILLTAAMIAALSATPAFAGWEQDQTGWYYQLENGRYVKGTTMDIDGLKYCFDANGYMVTGWRMVEGTWRYFGPSGHMLTGWVQDNGKWYFLKYDGTPTVSWYNDGKDTYYFYTAEDAMTIDGAVEGAMVAGRGISINGATYSFDTDGKQISNQRKWTAGGIDYRYNSGVFQWKNFNTGDWVQYGTKDELIVDIQDALLEKYQGQTSYASSVQFEAEAKRMFLDKDHPLMEEDDCEEYIENALQDHWGRKGSYDEYDD